MSIERPDFGVWHRKQDEERYDQTTGAIGYFNLYCEDEEDVQILCGCGCCDSPTVRSDVAVLLELAPDLFRAAVDAVDNGSLNALRSVVDMISQSASRISKEEYLHHKAEEEAKEAARVAKSELDGTIRRFKNAYSGEVVRLIHNGSNDYVIGPAILRYFVALMAEDSPEKYLDTLTSKKAGSVPPLHVATWLLGTRSSEITEEFADHFQRYLTLLEKQPSGECHE